MAFMGADVQFAGGVYEGKACATPGILIWNFLILPINYNILKVFRFLFHFADDIRYCFLLDPLR